MSTAVFTPKQIAQALGVSESSVKRWVDSGRLPAAKTAGGHRKVPLPSIAGFIRETGHHLAEPAILGMAPVSRHTTLESAQDDLFESLINGREAVCRELVLSFYQRGESIADLGDRLIGPVFRRVGDGWAEGTVRVHQERRSCEVMIATLHELRRWLAPPNEAAPLALVATPSNDFAETPARLVEITLLAEGWRVVMAGCGLPLEEIRDAALRHRPRLICLSVTHLEEPENFVDACNAVLIRPLSVDLPPAPGEAVPRFAIGGTAVRDVVGGEDRFDLVADSLADLVGFLATR